ncbi:hypothetical protein CK203_034678 [Vitis vinifera]|uniref:Uncharacterized protein n=1 Tax=Vitis vinifera TaxID=29760 RepID=A0A438HWF5_VITVI|nr:hypothetical protein CK203_034678 [Vitis vinifera]
MASHLDFSKLLGLGAKRLSLTLFVCASHVALSCHLKRARDGGFLLGFRVRSKGGEGSDVSHKLFANDSVVFYEASYDPMA